MFLPLLFMGGLSGRLFREFGVTIAGAVLISALVALTLTPMLSSRLLRQRQRPRLAVPQHRAVFHGARARLRAQGSAGSCARAWAPLALLVGRRRADLACFSARCRASSRRWKTAAASGCARRAPEGVGYDYMQRFMDELARGDRRAGARGASHDDAGARAAAATACRAPSTTASCACS